MAGVTNKATGLSIRMAGNSIVLSAPSVVKLSLSPKSVAEFQKIGNDLLIKLHNGETIRIINFYKLHADKQTSDLVFEDEDGALWQGKQDEGLADFNFTEISSVDQLAGDTGGFGPVLLGMLGLGAGVALIAAAASSGGEDPLNGDRGGGTSPDPDPDPDVDSPPAPTAALANDTGMDGDRMTGDGTVMVSGLLEGASWQYSTDNGQTWQEGSGTSFELEEGNYAHGVIRVRQTDATGNASEHGLLGEVTVDTTPPVADVVLSDAEGDNIPTASGTTEPGSTV
ncbi:BapA/Bap/LapF family prefix-like domain-containing protein, partial [Brucellaceae bacterium D45D]